jgi:hypothetical protein
VLKRNPKLLAVRLHRLCRLTSHENEEVPDVYSDLSVLMAEKAVVGAWGFEPQTPTVSR